MPQSFSFSHPSDTRGFTVLELMVGIVIFTLGFLGAYLLVDSANTVSVRSRDEIIGANVMREQIELLKNLRDTNWIQFRSWDSIELAKSPTEMDRTLHSGGYYSIANDFRTGKTVRIDRISSLNDVSKEAILQEFQKNPSAVRLCIDSLGRYVHDCSGGNRQTNYASFIRIEPLITQNTRTGSPVPVERAYKVRSFFVSFDKGFRLTSMSTVITDWKNR